MKGTRNGVGLELSGGVWEVGEEKWRKKGKGKNKNKKWVPAFVGARRCGVGRIEMDGGKKRKEKKNIRKSWPLPWKWELEENQKKEKEWGMRSEGGVSAV